MGTGAWTAVRRGPRQRRVALEAAARASFFSFSSLPPQTQVGQRARAGQCPSSRMAGAGSKGRTAGGLTGPPRPRAASEKSLLGV